jgi:uncharacterized protein (UPF0333 family)
MKRIALALTFIIMTLLAFIMAVAYYGSVNYTSQGGNASLTVSPTPTVCSIPSSSPTTTPSSTLLFDTLGICGIVSPSNTTYSSTTPNLEISGQVIMGSNVYLLANYSLDGHEPLPITIETQPPSGHAFVKVNGTATLSQLSEGSHSITVFGDIEANGSHLAQATVYCTIHLASP